MEEPKIFEIEERKLIGMRVLTSFANDKTSELWRGFRPRIREIASKINRGMYSVQVYNKNYDFKNFNPAAEFEKWAAIEVNHFDEIPDGMESHILAGGEYAVFIYKGLPSDFAPMFQYIFQNWLPNSNYELDQREHFEILGDKYNPFDPNSEEEIYIPIKSI